MQKNLMHCSVFESFNLHGERRTKFLQKVVVYVWRRFYTWLRDVQLNEYLQSSFGYRIHHPVLRIKRAVGDRIDRISSESVERWDLSGGGHFWTCSWWNVERTVPHRPDWLARREWCVIVCVTDFWEWAIGLWRGIIVGDGNNICSERVYTGRAYAGRWEPEVLRKLYFR